MLTFYKGACHKHRSRDMCDVGRRKSLYLIRDIRESVHEGGHR